MSAWNGDFERPPHHWHNFQRLVLDIQLRANSVHTPNLSGKRLDQIWKRFAPRSTLRSSTIVCTAPMHVTRNLDFQLFPLKHKAQFARQVLTSRLRARYQCPAFHCQRWPMTQSYLGLEALKRVRATTVCDEVLHHEL